MAAAIFAAAPVTAQAASRVPCDRAMIGNLPTAVTAHGAPEVAVASAYAALQRLRHQRQADLPAAAHTWLRWDRAVTGAASPLQFLSLLFLPTLLEYISPFFRGCCCCGRTGFTSRCHCSTVSRADQI